MPTMNTSSYEMDWERKKSKCKHEVIFRDKYCMCSLCGVVWEEKEICPLCNDNGGNWNNDVHAMEPCSCVKEAIPYNISEWKRVGELRGYFYYFAKQERGKAFREILDIMRKKHLDSDIYNNFFIDLAEEIRQLNKI